MATKSKQKSVPAPAGVKRDLAKVNPLKEQFEPTPAVPVRQRARMGGAA